MKPYCSDDSVTLYHGDCLDVLRDLPGCSVDAVVTDPPYGINFMGKAWDGAAIAARAVSGVDHTKTRERSASMHAGQYDQSAKGNRAFQEWCQPWAAECLRVLKPGGHMLAFGGSRTWHRLASAVEDAGFEIRDSIAWLYGSGFPKSLDVSKAIDKGTGENRRRQLEFTAWMRSTGITARQIDKATESFMGSHYLTDKAQAAIATADMFDRLRPFLPDVPERIEQLVAERTGIEWTAYKDRVKIGVRTGAQSDSTGRFGGWGNDNGNGVSEFDVTAPATQAAERWQGWGTALKPAFEPIVVGRKPLAGTVAANVLEHGTGALNIDGCRVETDDTLGRPKGTMPQPMDWGNKSGDEPFTTDGNPLGRWPANVVLDQSQAAELDAQSGILTSGTLAAHHARAPKAAGILGAYGSTEGERGYGDAGGASRFFPTFRYEAKAPTAERPRDGEIAHPTVKPLDLMRWLVRLVTPPGGTVLEPFAGSGTTAEACVIEGFNCIAIEREADYLPLIIQRLSKPIQVALDFGEGA